jgi:hypothetical protein
MTEQRQLGRETGVTRETVLRPHRHLFARGVIAIFALTTPVFAVLYWLAIPTGGWPLVLVAHLLIVTATVLCVYSFLNVTITLGVDGVRERGFFGRVIRVRPGEVGAIMLVQLYESSTLDTLPQLFITGTDGQLLIRMRGQFWSLENMERVAEELDVPVTRPQESMTLAQLRRTSPELLYWFERLPAVVGR